MTGITRRDFLKEAVAGGGLVALSARATRAGEPETTEQKGIVAIIGGAMTPKDYEKPAHAEYDDLDHYGIFTALADEIGGFEGKDMVVNMCATSDAPEQKGLHYAAKFLNLGAKRVFIVANEDQAHDREALMVLSKAPDGNGFVLTKTTEPVADIIRRKQTTGVFLGGGHQGHLVARVEESEGLKAMKTRLNHDAKFLVAGTSAGAAAVAKQMIIDDRYDEKGFGLIPWLTVETHSDGKRTGIREGEKFIEGVGPIRQTIRVTDALKLGKCKTGVAVEEGVCLIIPAKGDMKVCGKAYDEDEKRPKKVTFVCGGVEIPVEVTRSLPLSALGIVPKLASAGPGMP